MRFAKAATNTNLQRALTNHEWEKYCFVAVGSLYGVELLHDNCVACREWLYKILEGEYKHVTRKQQNPAFLETVLVRAREKRAQRQRPLAQGR